VVGLFGRSLDTKLQRLMSHDRNKMTQEEMVARARAAVSLGSQPCTDEKFRKFTGTAGDHFHWKGRTILDVACGNSDLVIHLAMQGAARVIDLDHERISVARSTASRFWVATVEFIESNFHEWAADERFDYVVSYEALDP